MSLRGNVNHNELAFLQALVWLSVGEVVVTDIRSTSGVNPNFQRAAKSVVT